VKASIGLAAVLCGLTLLFATGCNILSYPLAVMASEQTEKVPAEFSKLDGKKAVVVVWAQPETMLQFPHMRLELASQVTYQMKQRLKTTEKDPADQVADYQNRNLNWDALPPTQIGKQYEADYVVFIEVLEYSTRDPKTPGLFRGRAKASVVVHDAVDPTARWSLAPAVAEYPAGHSKVDNADDQVIHHQLVEILGSQITVKFYEHEVFKDTKAIKADKK
jgi:hypothetical protein